MASIYKKNEDLEIALEYQLKALKGAEAGGNKNQILENLRNLKEIYEKLGRKDEAKKIEEKIKKLDKS